MSEKIYAERDGLLILFGIIWEMPADRTNWFFGDAANFLRQMTRKSLAGIPLEETERARLMRLLHNAERQGMQVPDCVFDALS